jgi:hypothetical protein
VREQPRGTAGGSKYGCYRARASSTDVFTITFRAGEVAQIGVSGDGDSDLDLYIYDERGNLIASDTDAGDDCFVRWTPRWTGPFQVRVRNLGRVYNDYCLVTN